MDAHRIAIKFFLEDPAAIDRSRLVPMFHLWIREQLLGGHLLIDVADYQHVPKGPGVVLVAHEANVSADEADGRLGLEYSRKRPLGSSFADRLPMVLASALDACLELEHDTMLGEGGVKFRTDEFLLKVNDRLLAPNEPATLSAIRPELEELVRRVWRVSSVNLEQRIDPQRIFEILVKTGTSPRVADLLDRVPVREPI